MTLSTRILVGSALLVLLPLALLGQLVGHWMETRFTGQYHQRVDGLVEIVREDLDARRTFVRDRLTAFKAELSDDNRFRVGILVSPDGEGYVRDLASQAMRLLALDMLQVQDEDGRILSCGHYWSMYGTRQRQLPAMIEQSPDGWVILETSRQMGPFLVLAAIDSVVIGNRRLRLVGGVEIGDRYLQGLARGGDLIVSLRLPVGIRTTSLPAEAAAAGTPGELVAALPDSGRILPPAEDVVEGRSIERSVSLPFLYTRDGDFMSSEAKIRIRYPLRPLDQILRQFRGWLLLLLAGLTLVSLLFAFWLSQRIGRPIVDLARRAGGIDLDRLDSSFSSSRGDEVGALANCLDGMIKRLRTSTLHLREAEHRATLGEVARQVNHDIKNGLIPLRNVFRHLFELLDREPEMLPRVLRERRPVLEASIGYLEDLAANYARISRRPQTQRGRFNEVLEQIGASMGQQPGVQVNLDLDQQVGDSPIDPVALRRIAENLLRNACESLGADGGTIRLRTAWRATETGETGIELTVEDTGPGIPDEIKEKVFDDFFTTREGGSGLGLSIVRRLVTDFDGTIGAENLPDRGARFTVWFPVREQEVGPHREGDTS